MKSWIGIAALAGAGLIGGAALAQQAAPMSRAEAMALYAAGGFPISADGKNPTNRCGKPANPRITFLDLNGDKVKDALFTDSDTGACYGADKRFFAMAVKQKDGSWRGLGGWTGTAQAVGSDPGGWLRIVWTTNGESRPLAFNGTSYAAETAAPPPPSTANAARDAAIFRAAGFKQTRRGWESGCDDPSAGAPYDPGVIDQVKDLNGDGRPEAVVTEGGSFCYGNTGMAFSLVSQQADGSWKRIYQSLGIPEFLAAKGVGGWPDISVGGPGFCFPVMRWNGRAYVRHRMEYDGKPCKG